MDLGAALNNFANKITGGSSDVAENSNELKSTGERLKREYDTALGEKLSGSENKLIEKKGIEEKASELDELMEKLGLIASEESKEEIGLDEGSLDISKLNKDELIKMLEKFPDLKDKKEIPEDILKLLDEATFSKKEERDYVNGEREINRRLQEAIKNNPDADPAEMEKEIREAYAFENPAHAEAKAEVDAEREKHDAASKEASDSFLNENPVPELDNFDSVDEFNKAMDEWQANYESHMSKFENQYLEDNPKYEDTQRAEKRAKGTGIWDTEPIHIAPIPKPISPTIPAPPLPEPSTIEAPWIDSPTHIDYRKEEIINKYDEENIND